MPIMFDCRYCGQDHRVPDEAGGRSTRCRKCGSVLSIPAASGISTQLPSPPARLVDFDRNASLAVPSPRKKGAFPLGMIAAVLFVVLVAGSGGAWIAFGGLTGIQARLGGNKAYDGMRYLPDGTWTIMSVRPTDLLKSPAYDAMRKDPHYADNWFMGNSKLFGITAGECEQILLGGTDADTGVICVKLTRDMDLKKELFSRPGLKYVEVKTAGTTVFDLDLTSALTLAYEKLDPKEI